MKSVVVVLFFALVASSMSMSLFEKYPVHFNRGILKLFAQIQERISAGGPLDDVFAILDDEANSITQEQGAHTLLHNQQAAQCQTEIDFRSGEISDAQNAFTAADAQRDRCNQDLQSEQTSLDIANQNLLDATNNLGALNDLRESQVATFNSRTQDYIDASNAIDEAIAMIDEILTGQASFVQLAKLSSKMLKHAIKLRHTKIYAGVIAVFAQISAKQVIADEDALNKVVDLLNQLKANLEASNNDYINTETQDAQNYEDQKASFQSTIDTTNSQISDLNAAIVDSQNCIQVQSQICDQASSKETRNQQLLDDATNMCSNGDQEYEQQTDARNAELSLIEEIRAIIQSRFDELSDQVLERGKASADEWAAYQNAYQLLQRRKK